MNEECLTRLAFLNEGHLRKTISIFIDHPPEHECQRGEVIRDGDGARKADGGMNMVRHTADAIRLATGVARDRGEIRVEFRARVRVEEWAALLRAEDDVDDDEAQ